jgi:anti-sigma regulatory factor (Ser/Thr protein kinase)
MPIENARDGYDRRMSAGVDHRRLELYLPSAESAIGQARAAVDRLEVLDAHPEARFAVRLLVSELFTNAVKHGRHSDNARVRFAVDVGGSRVRVEVGDRGRGFVADGASMPGHESDSGRGLAFLDALASRWGVIRNGESCVWFELDI